MGMAVAAAIMPRMSIETAYAPGDDNSSGAFVLTDPSPGPSPTRGGEPEEADAYYPATPIGPSGSTTPASGQRGDPTR